MTARVERHAAKMRCENTESTRRRLWARLGRFVACGRMTRAQADAAKADFWDARRRDKVAAS